LTEFCLCLRVYYFAESALGSMLSLI
jgi:hypothetical protein